MRLHRLKWILSSLILAAAPALAEGGKGLVMAQFIGIDNGQVFLKGRTDPFRIERGFLFQELPAGTYEMEKVVNGDLRKDLDVADRMFKVAEGKATNLGAVALLSPSNPDAKISFVSMCFDNSFEARENLLFLGPEAWAQADVRFSKEGCQNAPVKVKQAREFLVKIQLIVDVTAAKPAGALFVGPAGTLFTVKGGELVPLEKKAVEYQQVFDTGSFSPFTSVAVSEGQSLFLTQNSKLFQLKGGKVKRIPLPEGLGRVLKAEAVGAEVLCVDEFMRLAHTRKEGREWVVLEDLKAPARLVEVQAAASSAAGQTAYSAKGSAGKYECGTAPLECKAVR